jgi:predicted ester cyclase
MQQRVEGDEEGCATMTTETMRMAGARMPEARMTGAVESFASVKRQLHGDLCAFAEAPLAALPEKLEALCAPDAQFRFSCPIDTVEGVGAALKAAFVPLKTAMPNMERRDVMVLAGRFEERLYVATLGSYCGTLRAPLFGAPPTGRPVHLRYGEVYRLEEGRIVQANCLWDILDLVRQTGIWPIAPSLGAEGLWPGPITGDGIRFFDSDPASSAASLAQTLAMHGTLGDYRDQPGDFRENLIAMPQRDHWHPRMMWYGPSGIGATRALEGFVDHHQLPFRQAFPNRKGGGQWDEIAAEKKRLGGGHYIRIGDGPYSVTGGWPSVFALHTGGGFLGVGPTGRMITMRVMDFYLHHEGLIRENWVPLDILDVLRQMGVDVLGRVRAIAAGAL